MHDDPGRLIAPYAPDRRSSINRPRKYQRRVSPVTQAASAYGKFLCETNIASQPRLLKTEDLRRSSRRMATEKSIVQRLRLEPLKNPCQCKDIAVYQRCDPTHFARENHIQILYLAHACVAGVRAANTLRP